MENKEKTKKEMIEAISKSQPHKSIKFLNAWSIKELEQHYNQGVECGLINEASN